MQPERRGHRSPGARRGAPVPAQGRPRRARARPRCCRPAATAARLSGRRRRADPLARQPGHAGSSARPTTAIESGLTPEAGQHAADLQLRRLPRARGCQGLREEVRRRHPAVDVQRRRRGADQDRHRELEFDIYFPSYDPIGRLVTADLLRPLNHDYLTNIANLWEGSRTPGTTRVRSTPCRTPSTPPASAGGPTRSPTTSAHRDNPYDVFWDTAVQGQHRGHRRLAHRDGHGAAAQRPVDMNSTDQGDIAMVREQLLELGDTMDPRSRSRCTTTCPPASTACARCGPGDAINTQYYLPKGTLGRHPALLVPRGRPAAWSTTT